MIKHRKLDFDRLDARALMSTILPKPPGGGYNVPSTLVDTGYWYKLQVISDQADAPKPVDPKLREFLDPSK